MKVALPCDDGAAQWQPSICWQTRWRRWQEVGDNNKWGEGERKGVFFYIPTSILPLQPGRWTGCWQSTSNCGGPSALLGNACCGCSAKAMTTRMTNYAWYSASCRVQPLDTCSRQWWHWCSYCLGGKGPTTVEVMATVATTRVCHCCHCACTCLAG